MELQQIRYFLAVQSHGSFSRAADECGVSQPALTSAMKKLEGEIGGPLFFREGKRVVITPMGRLVQPALEQALHGTQSATAIARNFQLLRQAPLQLGVMETIGPTLVARFLTAFQRKHPGVELTVQVGSTAMLLPKLEAGELDFAVTSSVQPLPDAFRSRPLYREPYVVTFAAGHRLARLDKIRLADLDGESYVDRLACELRESVMALSQQSNVNLYATFRSEREEWIQSMVAAGLGFAFMPLHSADPRQVEVRPLVDPVVERDILLVDVRGRQRSKAGKLFADEAAGHAWA
jgi:DNA-binding transcriptional LysR family regulator